MSGQEIKSETVEQLDMISRIISLDDRIVTLFDDLRKIDAAGEAAETEFVSEVKSIDSQMTEKIVSLDKRFTEHNKTLESQIEDAVFSLTPPFNSAIRDRIVGMQNELDKFTQGNGAGEHQLQIELDIDELKKTVAKMEKGETALIIAGGILIGFIFLSIICWGLFTVVSIGRVVGFGISAVIGLCGYFFLVNENEKRTVLLTEKEMELERNKQFLTYPQEIQRLTGEGEALLREQMESHIRQAEENKKQKEIKYREQRAQYIAEKEKNKQEKQSEEQQKRRERIDKFTNAWKMSSQTLKNIAEKIQHSQPPLNALTNENLNITEDLPETLVFGMERVVAALASLGFKKDDVLTIPHLLDFPFAKPLYDEYNESPDTVQQLLLRLLFAVPVGKLEITAIDPKRLGRSLSPFLPLAKIEKLVPFGHFLVKKTEIGAALLQFFDYQNNLMQDVFPDSGVFDWKTYNEKNPDKKLPYKLLFIFGFPEQFSEENISILRGIIEHGPGCGILPIITIDTDKINSLSDNEGKTLKVFLSFLKEKGQNVNELLVSHLRLRKLQIAAEPETQPGTLPQLLEYVRESYENHGKFSKIVADMWKESAFGKATSERELSVALGWNDEEQEVAIKFGDKSAHALLAGTTGSGKSNLLHVLIHGLLHNYTAEELNLYILTLKGNEFNIYNKYALPQIKLITMAPAEGGITEYGVKVLDFIEKTRKERQAECGDYAAFEKTTGKRPPRVLIIIDEFQELFREERDAPEKINNILKLARSAGIHILLATQTLSNVKNDRANVSASALMANIPCKVALKVNSAMDSDTMLGNKHATTLIAQKEAIIKDEDGESKFNVPQAKGENKDTGKDFDKICDEHLRYVSEQLQKSGFTADTLFFNGASLPSIPAAEFFGKYPSHIVPGLQLDITSTPFAFNIERRIGNNLCVAGIDATVRQGILHSILYSVHQSNDFDKVIYFNSNPNGKTTLPPFTMAEVKDHTWDCNIEKLTTDLQNQRTLLIIDTLDNARALFPKKQDFVPKTTLTTPQDFLKEFLDKGPQNGSYVVAFVDSWSRFNNKQNNDYLGQFELFIGFGLNDMDAGSLIEGTIGRPFKGLEKPNKAIFVNRQKNTKVVFRPFVVREV